MPKRLIVWLLALAALAVSAAPASAHSGGTPHHRSARHKQTHHRKHTHHKKARHHKRKAFRHDRDRDGLRNRAEVKRYHTNPRRRDTDRDGFSDGREVRAGTNPRDASSRPGSASPPSPPSAPAPSGFPNASNTGVPAGWSPAQTRSTDMTVRTPGAVVQDVLFTNGASLYVDAPNVTVRRVKLDGGWIDNVASDRCSNGLLLEDVTIDGGGDSGEGGEGAVSYGGYTARRVAILNRSEGFRSGAAGAGCTASTIQDSYVQIRPPSGCGDWHGDGIQGYESSGLTINNVTIDFAQGNCGGTAGFFYPGGPDGTPQAFANINRLLIKGGPYSFRLGTRGSVQGLKIVDGSWDYGPILISDAGCGAISKWDAQIVDVDSAFHVTRTVRNVGCR